MKKIVLMALAVSLWTAGYAKVNVAESENTAPAGVEAVDLGLSVKWANMNLGASKSSDYGTYYAWGETKPKKYYSWDTYAWSKGNAQYLIKYSPSDGKTQLEASDDAARANWGDDWRMPTQKEIKELRDKCTFTNTLQNGVKGCTVTGPNGNSIFLPYAGIQFRPVYGYYWTSTLYPTSPNKAWCLEFDFSDVNVHFGKLSGNRFSGRCIRAVR